MAGAERDLFMAVGCPPPSALPGALLQSHVESLGLEKPSKVMESTSINPSPPLTHTPKHHIPAEVKGLFPAGMSQRDVLGSLNLVTGAFLEQRPRRRGNAGSMLQNCAKMSQLMFWSCSVP